MSFIKVYIHFVWSTKHRYPFLCTRELRNKVWKHIKENALTKGIYVDHISGYTDHCHCLVSVCYDQEIQKIMQLIKGESSFWINQNKLTIEKFEWQKEYYATSISESALSRIRKYIRDQEMHHSKKSFLEECEENSYQFQIINR